MFAKLYNFALKMLCPTGSLHEVICLLWAYGTSTIAQHVMFCSFCVDCHARKCITTDRNSRLTKVPLHFRSVGMHACGRACTKKSTCQLSISFISKFNKADCFGNCPRSVRSTERDADVQFTVLRSLCIVHRCCIWR